MLNVKPNDMTDLYSLCDCIMYLGYLLNLYSSEQLQYSLYAMCPDKSRYKILGHVVLVAIYRVDTPRPIKNIKACTRPMPNKSHKTLQQCCSVYDPSRLTHAARISIVIGPDGTVIHTERRCVAGDTPHRP